MIDIINRTLAVTLLIAIVCVMLVGATLTQFHGTVTLSFGQQPEMMLAYAIPSSALGGK